MVQTRILHLLGSPTCSFYFDLSLMYGRTTVEFEGLDRRTFLHESAVVFCNGQWAFPETLDSACLESAARVSMGAAMARIEALTPPVDVVVPHMFCVEGMTRYRALFDMIGIEVLGCSAHTCSITSDKFLTKHLCKASGVPVPDGELLRWDPRHVDIGGMARELLERRSAPFIVKPTREDNSIGLTLVQTNSEEEVAAALSKAFRHDDNVLVEDYIAGRECCVAVLEMEDESESGIRLQVLPKVEYLTENIRTLADKLSTDSNGKLLSSDSSPAEAILEAKREGDCVCPAQFEPEVDERLNDLACRAHEALGCKYYSLYDVRINEDGFPFMLEANLFCSFSPLSVVVTLADQTGEDDLQPHAKLFEKLLHRAAAQTRRRRASQASAGPANIGRIRGECVANKPAALVSTAATASTGAGKDARRPLPLHKA